MAEILNAGDIILQATDPRLVRTTLPDNLVVPAVKEIKLSASAAGFRVTNTGISDLSEITFQASLIHIDETSTVFITIGSGGVLSEHTVEGIGADRTKKLLYTDMTATSVRITATVVEYPGTENEKTYTTFIDVVKVQDGYDAEYLVINGEQVFKHLPASVTPVNTSITLTARLYGHLTLYQWQYYDRLTNPANPTWTDITGATNSTYNLAYNFLGWGTQNNLSIRCASYYAFNNTTYTDEIAIVKLYDGVEGLTSIMPNASHTVPSNSDGIVVPVSGYVGSGTQIQVFDGATALQFTTNTTLQQGQFRIVSATVTPNTGDLTNVGARTVLTINNVNVGAVVANHAGMSNTVDVVKITYAIQARRYGDDSGLSSELANFNLDQTLTKSKAGVSSKSLRISSEGLVFTKLKDYTISPNRLQLTAKKQNLTVSPTWTNSANIPFRNASASQLTGSALNTDTVYIYASDLGLNTAIDITATAIQSNTLNQNPEPFADTEKLIVVIEGTDGLSVSMPNAAHTIPSNDLGVVLPTDYVNSGTTIRIYEGSEELDFVAAIGTNDRKKFSIDRDAVVVTPLNAITVGSFSDNASNNAGGMTVGDHSNMSSSASFVTIDYPVIVRRANGINTPLKLTQTITKSIAGVDAKSLKLTASSLTFKYDTDNLAEPASQTITFKAALENILNATPTFTCTLYNADNTVFNNGNNGVVALGDINVLEKTLTNTQFSSADFAKIECSLLYRNILYSDTQTVFRVKDGNKGIDGISPPRSAFRTAGTSYAIYLNEPATSWTNGTGVNSSDGNGNGFKASTVIWRSLYGANAGNPVVGSTAHLVLNDEVTLISASGNTSATRVWALKDGVYGWYFAGKVITGDLLVDGTITGTHIQGDSIGAEKINVTDLTITKAVTVGAYNIVSGYTWPVAGAGGGAYIDTSGVLMGNFYEGSWFQYSKGEKFFDFGAGVSTMRFSTAGLKVDTPRFKLNTNGSGTIDLLDIKRREVLANGVFDPPQYVSSNYVNGVAPGGEVLLGAGAVITGTVGGHVLTNIADSYAIGGSTTGQTLGVIAQFFGSTREYTGQSATFYTSVIGRAAVNRTFSNVGQYPDEYKIAITFDWVIKIESGSFVSFRLPQIAWSLYRL